MVNENIQNEPESENLLLQQTFLGTKEEPCQRSNFFRTQCKSGGKLCDIIVDSGSTDNLVAKDMV